MIFELGKFKKASQDDVQEAVGVHACAAHNVFIGGSEHILPYRESIRGAAASGG